MSSQLFGHLGWFRKRKKEYLPNSIESSRHVLYLAFGGTSKSAQAGIEARIKGPDSLLLTCAVESQNNGVAKFNIVINRGGPGKILRDPQTAFCFIDPNSNSIVTNVHDIGPVSGREHESHVRLFRRVGDGHILRGISETQAGGSYALRNCF